MPIGAVGDSELPPSSNDPVARRQGQQQPSLFELVTRLVLPIGFLVAAILQFQDQRGWFWGLIGLAFVSFLLGLYHPVIKPALGNIKHWRARRRDRRRIREASSEFASFVQRLGSFVDRERSGTDDQLGEIVERRIRKENIADVKTLGITDERIFRGFWERLHRRLEDGTPEPDRIVTAVEEFNHLFNQFLQETAMPIFDQLPQTVQADLSDRAKQDLNEYRERLLRLRDTYDDFATDFAESLETYNLGAPYLPRPKEHP